MANDMAYRIRELRKQRGLTLEQVADVVGVGKSTVRKWETGMIENMRRDKIASLAQALGTTPAYLMGWPEEDNCTEDNENPWELELLTAFAALDIDQQIKVVRQVNALAADSNHEFKLTPEGSIMIGKLTGKEVDLIIKYREKEHLQAAVDKLLDV